MPAAPTTYGSFVSLHTQQYTHIDHKKKGILVTTLALCALFLVAAVVHFGQVPTESAATSLASHTASFTIYESRKDSKQWFGRKQAGSLVGVSDEKKRKTIDISVDPRKKKQAITGFGGAFTDAAAYNIQTMSQTKQNEIFNAYFGSPETSLGYTLCRSHINSVDFSLESYTCDDVAGDYNLSHFKCEHDEKIQIPFIKHALKVHNAQPKKNRDPFRLFLSPWSPPAWMKSNGKMDGSGEQGLIADPKVHQAWAAYLSKFISFYEKHGIDIWGMTVQNEPANNAPWEACVYTKESMRDFIKDFLGPQLKQDHPKLKLMIWDHNRDLIVDWAKCILEDSKAAQYVSGTGFHWYAENSPSLTDYDHLDKTLAIDDSKFILSTEATYCPGTILGDWGRGEAYGWDMINSLKHGSVGWVDWNLVLDMKGGPNHANNLCDAPILVDAATQSIHYQPMFAFIGHFSKYVRPGAVQIGLTQSSKLHCRHQPYVSDYRQVCQSIDWACANGVKCDPHECTNSTWQKLADNVFDQWYQSHLSEGPYACHFDGAASIEGVQSVAFRNHDDTIAVVVLNVGEQPQHLELNIHGVGEVRTEISARSIQTIVVEI